jgi:hypothetical protein
MHKTIDMILTVYMNTHIVRERSKGSSTQKGVKDSMQHQNELSNRSSTVGGPPPDVPARNGIRAVYQVASLPSSMVWQRCALGLKEGPIDTGDQRSPSLFKRQNT